MEKDCWFRGWFDSNYYHLLYNKRDDNEANFFITNLCNHLHLPAQARIWDIACGKGRHTLPFAEKGFHVMGTDLSVNSITEALKNKRENLEFFVHDMRRPFRVNYFDCIVNLFTSIGYFENYRDNYTVFSNVHSALKPKGVFVVDFFNAKKVEKTLKSDYVEQRGEISFHIHKEIKDKVVNKKITFEHNGNKFEFVETVSLLTLEDFKDFASKSGLTIQNIFGNYSLENFNMETSDRLILIFKK
jgi:SAM-dependent methyltransferase